MQLNTINTHKLSKNFSLLCQGEGLLTLTNKAVAEALDGLPPHKMHCSVLAEEAIKKAVQNYYDNNGIAYDPADFPNCHDCEHCGM